MIKYFFRKVEKNMNKQYQQQQQQYQDSYQEDDHQSDPKNNKAKEELGDYVDFEEIPEDNKE